MSPLSTYRIVLMVMSLAVVIFSSILHECAHGYVAYRLGDPTAKNAGRLTLNPAAHLDPFGSVVLPLLMAFMGGPIFAYAKPVPYNPYNLRNRRVGEVLVALAGPCCNILQALVGALLFALVLRVMPLGALLSTSSALAWVARFLIVFVQVNLVLAFFNLIPLPPLDGSKVISLFLSDRALDKYYQVQRYSMVILLVVLYVVPMVFDVDILGIYLDATAYNLANLLLGMAG